MAKQIIRLTESELVNVVKNVINEMYHTSTHTSFRMDRISEWTVKNDGDILSESSDWILQKKNWEVNNYARFLDIVDKTPRDKKGFLTYHGMDEITGSEWRTYTLKGHDVAFALHYLGHGQVDICNLVNNDKELKGIGARVLTFAKMEGGTQMDNYRGSDGSHGHLGTLYRKNGFDRQTWHDTFNPDYQPANPEWRIDTNKWGTPDVEGLERSKHRMKYNTHFGRYKEKFDRLTDKKFK